MGFKEFILNLPSLFIRTTVDNTSLRPALTLVLSRDNPYNTTLYRVDEPSVPLYSVITKRKNTYIHRGSLKGQILAHLEWKGIDNDIVHLEDQEPQPFDRWLKPSLVPFKDGRSFKDNQGRKYRWMNYVGDGEMQLFALDVPKQPIVTYKSSRRKLKRDKQKRSAERQNHRQMRACLHLQERAVEIQDLVVTTFLFLEKQRRGWSFVVQARLALAFGGPPPKFKSKGQVSIPPRERGSDMDSSIPKSKLITDALLQ